MKRILVYAHVPRTFAPVTGYGRHAVEVVDRLAARDDMTVEVLASSEFVRPNGQLDPRSPFAKLPVNPFPWPERRAERSWKLLGRPTLDPFVGGADVVYSPFDTYLPIRSRPWVLTLHDPMAVEPNMPGGWRPWLYRRLWRVWGHAAVRAAALVFTSTEFSKRRIVELIGADPNKVVVVGNGVDDRFHLAADLDAGKMMRPCKDPYLAVVGGLVHHKGGDVILQVADALHALGSPIRVVVAGRSNSDLEASAVSRPNIIRLGRIADAELIPFVRGALALLFPSWYEGFGLPALEAMAAGVPAIVSDRGSLPEVVGSNGLIVSPLQPKAMADLAVQLLNHPSIFYDHIQQAKRRSRQYTWENVSKAVAFGLMNLT